MPFSRLEYWGDDDINWTKEIQQKVLRVGEELYLFWHFEFEVLVFLEDIEYVVGQEIQLSVSLAQQLEKSG